MGRGLGRGLALVCVLVAACFAAPVASAAGPALSVTPSAVGPGQAVTVSWTGVAAPTTTDWIGLYRQGAADTSITFWFFTATCTSTAGAAKAAGSCPVTMPTTTGTYELRLFANNGYTRLATSGPVTVGGSPPPQTDPVLLAAGDIAACATQYDEATAAILGRFPAATVATLGDNAYDHGTPVEFRDCYGPSWGQYASRTHPSVGNHDYDTLGASGYFGYFGAAAGTAGQGWYSYDLGAWHIVVLNSNCSLVGGCGAGSAQETWLRADLAAHPAACTLAYWHHPLFTSGWVGNDPELATVWSDLQARRADVVLNGHAHLYERLAPQTSAGIADPNGLREFVVGTGGDADLAYLGTIAPNSEVIDNVTFGVLKLTLHPTSYDWQFLPVTGQPFTDAGSASCHGPDTAPPSVSLTAPAQGATVSGSVQVAANAADNVGVTKVEFLANGSVVATDTAAPWAATWDSTSVANGQAQLAARASDAAGNTTTSTVQTVTVQNNSTPAWATVSASPTTVGGGGTVTVSWSGVATPTSTDWIGLFPQGAANTASVRWFYTATCSSSTGAAKAAGSCPLTMPATAGTYELRLFPSNGYTVLATSGQIVVGGSPPPSPPTVSASPSAVAKGGSVTVGWSGVAAATSTDWIGLFPKGAANTASVRWFYTATCSSSTGTAKAAGSCPLTMPATAGTYELRLFPNNGYTVLATSSLLTVS